MTGRRFKAKCFSCKASVTLGKDEILGKHPVDKMLVFECPECKVEFKLNQVALAKHYGDLDYINESFSADISDTGSADITDSGGLLGSVGGFIISRVKSYLIAVFLLGLFLLALAYF